jgi:hypothetical protein
MKRDSSSDQSQAALLNKSELENNLNIDIAFKKVGGFGTFQLLATVAITIMRNSGMYMYYGFGFLTLEQSYVCVNGGSSETCSATSICQRQASGETVDFRIDTSNINYISNWI